MIEEYINMISDIPEILNKYLELNIIKRLKKVGYFCGMDYASKDIYDFSGYISRYDHSLTTAILTWRYTNNKKATIAALFHDVATPVFSHVIDYMNNDYLKQESTEEKTKEILDNDEKLKEVLLEDNLRVEDLDFKKYSIVDNDRPKLCMDRLDGIILTSLFWTKKLDIYDIKNILDSIKVYKNEDLEDEIGFVDVNVLEKIVKLNDIIDIYCHSREDTYMMMLLSDITRKLIGSKINYDNLYIIDEEKAIEMIKELSLEDIEVKEMLDKFLNIKKADIPNLNNPKIKKRVIKPLFKGRRYEIL